MGHWLGKRLLPAGPTQSLERGLNTAGGTQCHSWLRAGRLATEPPVRPGGRAELAF